MLRPFVALAAVASLVLNAMVLAPSLLMLQVFDRVFASGSIETLAMLVTLVAACLGLMTAMDIVRARCLAWAGAALDRRLGPEVLRALLQRSASVGGGAPVHALRDVALLRGFVGGGGVIALFDAPWLPLYLLIITAFDPWLGLVALVGAAGLFGLVWLNERQSRARIEASTQGSRQAARMLDAALRNAEVIAGSGMGEAVVARWSAANEEVLRLQAELMRQQSTLQASVRLARQLLQVAMTALGAWLVVREHASPGIMVASSILLGRALQPLEQMIGGWRSLVEARAAWARLRGEPLPAVPAGLALPAPQGRLEVERLVFHLPGQREPLIKGIALALQPGDCLGVVGPSGSGKTTLMRLLLGIWRAQAGAVRLDGADVAQLPPAFLAQHVGYLPQDVELFAGTVAENIARLGPVDDAQVLAAAQLAGVHELILRLPQGYETPIGEAGGALSGGQRQRVALARALYGAPRLLVLDEPNASLDAEGEQALAQALSQLKARGTTVVMVGHRPSMMRVVDKLAVVREGRLEMMGPREQVLAWLQAPSSAQPQTTVQTGRREPDLQHPSPN